MLNPLDFAIDAPEGSKKPYKFSYRKMEQKFKEECLRIGEYPNNFQDIHKYYLLMRLGQYNHIITWIYFDGVRFLKDEGKTTKDMFLTWPNFEKWVIENCPVRYEEE